MKNSKDDDHTDAPKWLIGGKREGKTYLNDQRAPAKYFNPGKKHFVIGRNGIESETGDIDYQIVDATKIIKE